MNYNGYSSYDLYNYSQGINYAPVNTFSSAQQTDIFTYPQNLQNALTLIQQALSGETEDRMFYSWLISNAPSNEDQQIISGIRDNEIGHYELFNQIFYEITGAMPQQVPSEQFTQPGSYCAGLATAILDEQNAVQKYRKILYAMQDRVHINMMTEIITDEIRHGILYNYLYSKNSCGGH